MGIRKKYQSRKDNNCSSNIPSPPPPHHSIPRHVAEQDALSMRGYIKNKQIAPTLQGEVFTAYKTRSHCDYVIICGYIGRVFGGMCIDQSIYDIIWSYYSDKDIVIKTAQKSLHFAGVTIKDGNRYKIQEDIVKEAKLMNKFMNNSAPDTMIKYYDFFEDDDTYYLVMEKGGKGLFEFCVEGHKLINCGKINIKYWRKCVKFIFAKMCGFIAWMHNEMTCCNLDISLENIVMRHDTCFNEKTGEFDNLDIRFIGMFRFIVFVCNMRYGFCV